MLENFFKRSNHNAGPAFETPVDLTEAERLEEKRQKMALGAHGPRTWREPTNGQRRRAQARFEKTQQRKANKRHRRQWLAQQAALSSLRGQVNVAELGQGSLALQATALQAIERRFGEYDEDGALANNPLKAAEVYLLEVSA